MDREIKIRLDEIKKVYLLLEDLNDFFHQEKNYSNVKEFADQNYERIHDCYYKTVWEWFPKDIQEKLQDE